MRIEHVAIWTHQLEVMREFYERYFNGRSSPRYTNPRTGFQSYFVSFGDGARLELMQMDGIGANPNTAVHQHLGYIHLAMSVGGETAVCKCSHRTTASRRLHHPRRTAPHRRRLLRKRHPRPRRQPHRNHRRQFIHN
jgi:lactoylglutathione lyase